MKCWLAPVVLFLISTFSSVTLAATALMPGDLATLSAGGCGDCYVPSPTRTQPCSIPGTPTIDWCTNGTPGETECYVSLENCLGAGGDWSPPEIPAWYRTDISGSLGLVTRPCGYGNKQCRCFQSSITHAYCALTTGEPGTNVTVGDGVACPEAR